MPSRNLFEVLCGDVVIVYSKEDEFEKSLGYVVTWNQDVELRLWLVRNDKFVEASIRTISYTPMSFRVASVIGRTWLKELQDEGNT